MSGKLAVDIIADWLDEVETSAGVEWPFPTDALAEHVVSVLAASGHTIMQVPELDELDCVSATPGSGKVRCYLDDARMTADDARDLAGLLLAAAAAAEEDKT